MMEKVFVGNLPGDVNEGSLRKLLEQEGIDFNNISMRRNYAFITFDDKPSSEKIVKKLNGYNFEGSVMQVEPSNGKRSRRSSKIQISNIPSHCSKEQIEELVNATSTGLKKLEQGAEGIINVTFNNAEDAEGCLTQLNEYRFEDGAQLKVEFFRNQKRSARSNSSTNSGLVQEFPLRIMVGSDYVGAIIGKQGKTIKKITSESRARVDIHRRESLVPDTLVTIKGSPESCSSACQEIMSVIRKEAEGLNRGAVPYRILCPNSICGRIIGKQGKVIKEFMEKSNANIVVSSYDSLFPGSIMESGFVDRVIVISGSSDNCKRAEGMLSEKMRQCFDQDRGQSQYGTQSSVMYPGASNMSMLPSMGPFQGMRHSPMQYMNGSYSNFYGTPPMPQMQNQQYIEMVHLYIPEKTVGAVIGSKGQNIKNIMRLSGARVKIIGANDKNGSGENNSFNHSSNERKAVISGTSENQWKAQFYIFEKIKNELRLSAHDEVHLRTELSVPKQSIGRIIGRGGQNVREMQRVSGAIVQLPMDDQGDVDEVPITIIGHFYATQSAQRRVRALMNSFSRAQPQPRRVRPGAPQMLL